MLFPGALGGCEKCSGEVIFAVCLLIYWWLCMRSTTVENWKSTEINLKLFFNPDFIIEDINQYCFLGET